MSIINPATEVKTRLEISLEEVFSALGISLFARVYHGQSSKRKKAKEKDHVDFSWMEKISFYLHDNSRVGVDEEEDHERLLSSDPSLNPLIRRNSLLYRGFILVYMVLCDKAIPHIKDRNRIAFANSVLETKSYDAEKVFLDFNHSGKDGTLIEKLTVASFTLNSKGMLQDYPLGRTRARRLPREIREKLPQLEVFLCYEPGPFEYGRFKADLATAIRGR
ncbi:hypothetical protein KY325_01600 [Candidatus Woesearchaeota archaeon]|nr:hypothetical protein [Candidatus Woesearchaeota archaeon]MBW3017833.1 hypothetical protein [Candidatus Woesearchaeota archaeon]